MINNNIFLNTDIPQIKANAFLGRIDSGVSKPLKLKCNNSDIDIEYDVKLKTKADNGILGLSFEVIGTRLAQKLEIETPDIAFVELTEEFANSIEDIVIKNEIINNLGLNFGSKFNTGSTTWLKGQSITNNIKQAALNTFIFDAMIQNPDRTYIKPNILIHKDKIILIDHEKGFSFVRALFNKLEPWKVSKLSFLRKHIFYSGLKSKSEDLIEYLDSMEKRLEALTENDIDELFLEIPEEWGNEYQTDIKNHLMKIINNSDKFIYELKILLA